jgi:tetratricopeptide (TPR) repeat protein
MPSIAQLEKLLDPANPDPFVLYGLALEYAKAKEFGRAIGFYDRCLAADPHYCYAYFHKARAQEAAGDVAGALATIEVGMKMSKEAGDSHAVSELEGLRGELE